MQINKERLVQTFCEMVSIDSESYHEKKMKDTAEQLTKQQVSLATLTAKYTAVSEQLPFAEKREAQERLHSNAVLPSPKELMT